MKFKKKFQKAFRDERKADAAAEILKKENEKLRLKTEDDNRLPFNYWITVIYNNYIKS